MTSDKERMADRDRARRDYEETYGRGGGDRFDEGGYTQSYGTPDVGVGDWRRAMRAYVAGHDRGWSADRKYREAGESEERGERVAEREAEREGEGAPSDRIRFGVGVPDREDFSFHRGASTWRDRLPRSERLPRHTDRELDGQRGEGDQA
ncbi:MAG: hypothetical protein R3199_12415 [Gemmatimonadota bacterium]|nr:hypothetical protein [Gemmatimonadota bacterium]